MGGAHWQQISDLTGENSRVFQYTYVPDVTMNSCAVKVIIKLTDTAGLEEAEAQTEAELKAAQAELDEINSQIDEIKAQISLLEEQGEMGEAEKADLEEELATLQASLTTKKRQKDALALDTSEYITYIKTDKLVFTNKREQDDSTLRDFTLFCADNDYDTYDISTDTSYEQTQHINPYRDGVFNCYDTLTNLIVDSHKGSKQIIARFTLYMQNLNKNKVRKIEWLLPKNNTMIKKPSNTIEYTITEEGTATETTDYCSMVEDDNYYVISYLNPALSVYNKGTNFYTYEHAQKFRILDNLINSYNNNTIVCRIYLGDSDEPYEQSKMLYFGTCAQQGTSNTLIVSLGTEYDSANNVVEPAPPA